MFCPYCGKEIVRDAAFCPFCGKQMPDTATLQTPAPVNQPPTSENLASTSVDLTPTPANQTPANQTSADQPAVPVYQQPVVQAAPVQSPPAMPPVTEATAAGMPAGQPPVGRGKTKVLIAAAVGAVLLVGAFAAAWFSGALDGALDREPSTAVTAESADAGDTETAAATDATAARTTSASAAGGAATTTAVAAATTAENRSWALPHGLFYASAAEPYVSGSEGSRAAVEEILVNFSNDLLGSVRAAADGASESGPPLFGVDFDIGVDINDAYLDMLLPYMMGSYVDPQIRELARVICASDLRLATEFGAQDDGSTLGVTAGMDAVWSVGGQPLVSALAYADADDVLISLPEIVPYIFRAVGMSENYPPEYGLEAGNLESLYAALDKLGGYAGEAAPYVQNMLLAAVAELDIADGRPETLILAGKSVEFETADITLTEENTARALIAALTVFVEDEAAVELAVEIWNEALVTLVEGQPADVAALTAEVRAAIEQYEVYADSPSDEQIFIRLYLRDGWLAGFALANQTGVEQFGCVADASSGYSIWVNDMPSHSEATQKDPGEGARTELHGALSNGADGLAGDLSLMIRENGETFDEKLMTFDGLKLEWLFGMPAVSGAFHVTAADLYDAFEGKEESAIYAVSEMAYTLDPALKDMLYGLELTVESSVRSDEVLFSLALANPAEDSGITLAVTGRRGAGEIQRPDGGEMFDMEELTGDASRTRLSEIAEEAMANIDGRVDALTERGYDVAWVKPMIGMYIQGLAAPGDTESSAGGAGAISADSFPDGVFPNSADEPLVLEDLLELSPEVLRLGRNEIYARHGWVFTDIDIQMYFNLQAWYIPLYDNDSVVLNDIETHNLMMIATAETTIAADE